MFRIIHSRIATYYSQNYVGMLGSGSKNTKYQATLGIRIIHMVSGEVCIEVMHKACALNF